jgi:hypothetical protein
MPVALVSERERARESVRESARERAGESEDFCPLIAVLVLVSRRIRVSIRSLVAIEIAL